jgi:hypothetical protein
VPENKINHESRFPNREAAFAKGKRIRIESCEQQWKGGAAWKKNKSQKKTC